MESAGFYQGELQQSPAVGPCGRSLRHLCTLCNKPRRCRDTKTGGPREVCVQSWGSPAPKAPLVRGGSSLSPLNSLPESQPCLVF